jgi:hypothetical protein
LVALSGRYVISVHPNSLGDQLHGAPQPFLASGVPINAYDLRHYRKLGGIFACPPAIFNRVTPWESRISVHDSGVWMALAQQQSARDLRNIPIM